ncbi:hypothetical protein C5167_026369 [Papaver somniferum]|nr:hypothetical protein C5167_026369 [Papaver somniferum]
MVVLKIFCSSKKAREVDKEEVSLKISMETMIRQFVKYVVVEEEEEEPEVSTQCSHMRGKRALPGGAAKILRIDWSRIMLVEPVNGLKMNGMFDLDINGSSKDSFIWNGGSADSIASFSFALGWNLELSIISWISQDLLLTVCRRWLTTGVTFNEPHVFCMLTYCAGTWPGGNPDMLQVAVSALPTGVFKLTVAYQREWSDKE